MSDALCPVGDGLARAMVRAEELGNSPGRVRVRIVTRHADLDPGVIIVANVPAKTNPELEVQLGKGVRHVALADLDARAHELADLVDEAAAEVEAAVAAAPPPPVLPSRCEPDFDGKAFEDLIQSSFAAMLSASKDLADRSRPSLSRGATVEAVAMAALKLAAFAAQGARIELSDLVESLGFEYREARKLAMGVELSDARVH